MFVRRTIFGLFTGRSSRQTFTVFVYMYIWLSEFALNLKTVVFLVVTPCSSGRARRFEGTCRHHLQWRKVEQATSVCWFLLAYSSSLNEGGMLLRNVEFSQNYTRCYNPDRRRGLFVVNVVKIPNCTLNLVLGSFAVRILWTHSSWG